MGNSYAWRRQQMGDLLDTKRRAQLRSSCDSVKFGRWKHHCQNFQGNMRRLKPAGSSVTLTSIYQTIRCQIDSKTENASREGRRSPQINEVFTKCKLSWAIRLSRQWYIRYDGKSELSPLFGIQHSGARRWRSVRETCGSVSGKQYVLPLLWDPVDVAWHTIWNHWLQGVGVKSQGDKKKKK